MAFASCLSVSSFGVTIPGLPQSAFADSKLGFKLEAQ